jgi:hypothetical protein
MDVNGWHEGQGDIDMDGPSLPTVGVVIYCKGAGKQRWMKVVEKKARGEVIERAGETERARRATGVFVIAGTLSSDTGPPS